MEKYFVNYEIASKLEELGFDEKCLATIDNYGYLHINGTRRLPGGAVCVEVCKCSLIDQAIEWLENKYNLDFIFCTDSFNHISKGYKEYKIVSLDKSIIFGEFVDQKHWTRKGLFKSKVEAKLASIEHVLKFVK